MAGDWRSSTWGNEISLEYGKVLRGYEKAHGKYRVFGSNGPIGWTSEPLSKGPGVILGRKGAYRGVQYSTDPFYVIDTAYYVIPKTDLDMRWLYYAIMYYKLGEVDDGSPIPSTTRAAVYMMDIEVPPLPEQKAIADILGSLDDKIELNRRTNETLEAMARSIFKSWFVDFDPVHAKSRGRPPDGMDAETAGLFPSSFQESEIGQVPKGWRIKPLTDLIEVNPGRQLTKGAVAPHLDMRGLPTSSARTDVAIPRAFSSGSKFRNGDTLVARITPCLENGKTGFVDSLEEGQIGWGSTEFIVLRPKSPIPPPYAYFLARTEAFRSFAVANMTGTSGRQRVVVDSFSHFLLPSPPIDLVKKFGDFALTVFGQMKANDAETASLLAIRDTLLPKLLSGDLNVSKSTVRHGVLK